jgi:hypothetical protein
MYLCTIELRCYIYPQKENYFIVGRQYIDPGLKVGDEFNIIKSELDERLGVTGKLQKLKVKVIERRMDNYTCEDPTAIKAALENFNLTQDSKQQLIPNCINSVN